MKVCSLTATDGNGDGNANFADFLTFASKFGSRSVRSDMTPGAISMAMVKLTLPISSSSPPTLAPKADNCERCEKTKARVHRELGLYFLELGPTP